MKKYYLKLQLNFLTIFIQISRKNNEKVEDLDSTMKMLQHKGSVTGKSLAGDKETVEKPKIPVVPRKELVDDQIMDDLAESMNSS